MPTISPVAIDSFTVKPQTKAVVQSAVPSRPVTNAERDAAACRIIAERMARRPVWTSPPWRLH